MRLALRTAEPARLRTELLLWRGAAVIVAATVVAGVVQAVLWSSLAPGEQFQVAATGGYGALPTESYHLFTSVAIFLLLGIVVGVVLASAAWHWRSIRGVTAVLTVAGANGLGALTAYLLGPVLASGVDPASVGASSTGSLVTAAPILGSAIVIVVQPAVAAAVYTFLVAWNGQPDLGAR